MLLFSMATDVLSKKISASSPIMGLSLGSASIELQQYADDTILFLTDPSEVSPALQLIQDFSSHSNLQINKKGPQLCLTTSIFQIKLKTTYRKRNIQSKQKYFAFDSL